MDSAHPATFTLTYSATLKNKALTGTEYTNIATMTLDDQVLNTNNATVSVAALTTDIAVSKTWSDTLSKHDNQTIKVNLYKFSTQNSPVAQVELSKDTTYNNIAWASAFTDMPVYEMDGTPIQYIARELDCDGNIVEDGTKAIFESGSDTAYTVNYSYSLDEMDRYVAINVNNTLNLSASDLKITKTADKTKAKAGDDITYTINVGNYSDGANATNIAVKDLLPTDLTFVSASDGGVYNADPANHFVT